ncbi:kinase-like domain-containing protein [Tuber brumale]|nr:kinase-like domain-containing protein [Tuber brumale]
MDKLQSDLVVWYRLETEFFQDHVRHTRDPEKTKDRNKKVKEDWSNCGELGKGGFGVVNKQIQKTTGCYRAVKKIDKRLPHNLDYSRELLVMAILAKRPSLFVEFLGWFEEPETLYIAMEYLEEGDLTKHIGTPLPQETVRTISKQILEGLEVMHQQGIAHRDLKPANIFVVSMSPVWVKLGDFGISKRILAQDTTTLHTQVSTRVYGAPEVLGLDSNSETSDYTNSVDIWSFGCVVYELLVGTKLFVSEGQVFRYYIGKFPFPEEKLKVLSPPIDDIGVSFLQSMLATQPEDRPTASSALGHVWLVGVQGENEDGRDDRDKPTNGRDERTRNDKSENKIAAYDRRTKRRSEESTISQGSAKYAPRNAAPRENLGPQNGSDPTTPESMIDTSMLTDPDGPTEIGIDTSHLPSGSFEGPHGKEKKSYRLYFTDTQKQTHKAPASVLDETTARIAHRFKSDDSHMSKDEVSQNPRPKTRSRRDSRSQDATTIDPTENPNTRRNLSVRGNPMRNPNAGWNPNRYPNTK